MTTQPHTADSQRITYLHDRFPVGPIGRLIAERGEAVPSIDPITGARVSVASDGSVESEVADARESVQGGLPQSRAQRVVR